MKKFDEKNANFSLKFRFFSVPFPFLLLSFTFSGIRAIIPFIRVSSAFRFPDSARLFLAVPPFFDEIISNLPIIVYNNKNGGKVWNILHSAY